MIVGDSSVWIDGFHGVSTPEVERPDGLLGVTPVAIGDLIQVEGVPGFRQEKEVGFARQLLHSLALLPVLGTRHAWKAAERFREPRHCGITVRRRITGIIATACNCFAEACGYEAKLPLLFSDRDVLPQAIVSAGVSGGWRTITARSRSESSCASPRARDPKTITACTSGSAHSRLRAAPQRWGSNPDPSSGVGVSRWGGHLGIAGGVKGTAAEPPKPAR